MWRHSYDSRENIGERLINVWFTKSTIVLGELGELYPAQLQLYYITSAQAPVLGIPIKNKGLKFARKVYVMSLTSTHCI
jgi:hypothetical protein